MRTLILVDHDNTRMGPASRNLVAAAQQIGAPVDLLVAGENCRAVAESAAQLPGVEKVLLADHAAYAHQLAENVSGLLLTHAEGYSHILAAANTTGKNILPRVAALLGVAQISDVLAVETPDTFKRPIYAGNAIARVQALDATKLLTIRVTGFDPVAAEGGSAEIITLDTVCDAQLSRHIRDQQAESARPELTTAERIISGGRGLGSAENFALLEKVADKLGAAVGASRAAVDAGFVPNELQVGQTGKIVAPQLYIAVGLSGAIQHLAGMKNSKVIVAINTDEDAPIFQVADYGLVADLFEVLPELESKL